MKQVSGFLVDWSQPQHRGQQGPRKVTIVCFFGQGERL